MLQLFHKKIISQIKNWTWFPYLIIFSITFIIFLWILTPPGIIGPDSFYHVKMAQLIKTNGLVKDFPWTQFTTYKDLFVDHHFGYHLLLIPFLNIPSPKNLGPLSAEIDPLIKGKLATAFFAALLFLVIYWFLKKIKVKKPFIWTSTLFLIAPFLARISLIRAIAISASILTLGLYFILKRKYISLFILSIFYVWIYGAWPLILLAVIIYCLADTIWKIIKDDLPLLKTKHLKSKIKKFIYNLFLIIYNSLRHFFAKNNIKLLSACISGLLAGLIINPYFPKTFPFYWFQTIKIAIFNCSSNINIGAEWYPPNNGFFLSNMFPVFILYAISIAWFLVSIKKQKKSSWFLFLISLFFFFYTVKSIRNVEYFTPLSIFFSATIFTQINKKINWQKIKERINEHFQCQENFFYFLTTVLTGSCVIFTLIFFLNRSFIGLRQTYKNSRPLNHLQMASRWLKKNSHPSDIIFQSNWDIFPELFYFNSQNYYINGLDQTFMYQKNKNLYQVWSNLVLGEVNPRNVNEIIKKNFNASYVLLSKDDKKIVHLLKKSSLDKKYEDDQAIIYKIH